MSRLDFVGIGKQTAFGTKNTTPTYYPPVETSDAAIQRASISSEETTGNRGTDRMAYGTSFWEVPMRGAVRAASFPRILSGFLGAPTTTTPDGTNAPTGRKHAWDAIALAGALVPHSLYVVRKDSSPVVTDLVYDCYGNEMTISVEPNGFLTYECTWVGRDLDDTQSAPTPTRDSTTRWPFHQVKAYLTVNGGAETEVKVGQTTIRLQNSIDTGYEVLGSQRLSNLGVGNLGVEASFQVKETDLSAHYRRALLGTPDSVKLRLAAVGAKIGSAPSAVFYTAEFTVALGEYTDAPLQVNAADRTKMIDVRMRGALDVATNKMFDCFVQNEVASY